MTQAMANMDDAIKQSQLKDSELTELQKNVAGALSAFISAAFSGVKSGVRVAQGRCKTLRRFELHFVTRRRDSAKS